MAPHTPSTRPARLADAERAALLDASRALLSDQLGRPTRLAVDRLEHQGDWAFLWARLVDERGRPASFVGTPLAEAEREGMVSKNAALLLRRAGGRWAVEDAAVGPTDVAWADWADRHGAPADLFG